MESPTPSSSPKTSDVNVGRFERLASVVGGGLLATVGLRRAAVPRMLLTATGGLLATRGVTGHSKIYDLLGLDTARPGRKAKPVRLKQAITVYRPREEVYGFWRELSNLPRFMPHLEKVEDLGESRSRWTARAPRDLGTITWEAEVTEDDPGRRLAWRSRPGADITNAGIVRFEDLPGERTGTEVHLDISYGPPPGDVGSLVGQMLNPINKQLVKEDMRRFKRLMETGEIPTTEGQPTCRDE